MLQLPLPSAQQPALDLMKSQGRFVAIQREFLDPATVPQGTFLTITGELTGSMTLPLDETDYVYPLIEIKSFRTWLPSPRLGSVPLPSLFLLQPILVSLLGTVRAVSLLLVTFRSLAIDRRPRPCDPTDASQRPGARQADRCFRFGTTTPVHPNG